MLGTPRRVSFKQKRAVDSTSLEMSVYFFWWMTSGQRTTYIARFGGQLGRFQLHFLGQRHDDSDSGFSINQTN